jgi:hypothetical protein
VSADPPRQTSTTLDSALTIAHFGDLSSARVDVEPFLAALSRNPRWREVEFHQFGADWTGVLSRQNHVRVVFHRPRPWAEVIALAASYDLAVVIGNRDPKQLPSKAIAYLQLPIPRAAVVDHGPADALRLYVADKEGWLVVPASGEDAADLIEHHISRGWTAAELAPPDSERWERVSREIADFVVRRLAERNNASTQGEV